MVSIPKHTKDTLKLYKVQRCIDMYKNIENQKLIWVTKEE